MKLQDIKKEFLREFEERRKVWAYVRMVSQAQQMFGIKEEDIQYEKMVFDENDDTDHKKAISIQAFCQWLGSTDPNDPAFLFALFTEKEKFVESLIKEAGCPPHATPFRMFMSWIIHTHNKATHEMVRRTKERVVQYEQENGGRTKETLEMRHLLSQVVTEPDVN